ncbi:MAG TPA: acyltransferase [Thermoanaerobaculia bacterium]|jgi:hypothetical protein
MTAPATTNRNIPMDYLRMFLTLLVVAHHAALAYHPYAPPRGASLLAQPRLWMAFPVIDSAHMPGADLLVGFNDVFFMSLMFLISGIFTAASLTKKGPAIFLRDRARKLGMGFVVSAAILAPLAYYPAYLSMTPQRGTFWRQWLALGEWPAGPAWFLWLLLAFASMAGIVHAFAPGVTAGLGRFVARVGDRPIRFFAAMVVISSVTYLPMAARFEPFRWVNAGPFYVQISRLLHYFAYFVIGMALGAYGVDRGLLANGSRLARRWVFWSFASLAAFAVALTTFVIILSTLAKGGPGPLLGTFGNFTFVLSCAASSLAFLALFLRFAHRRNRVADSLAANAFGIYLVHYFCVSWLQFALLGTRMSGAAKGPLVFLGAVAASWMLVAGFRRLAAIGRAPRTWADRSTASTEQTA